MKVTVIPTIIGAIGTVTNGLVNGLEAGIGNKITSRDPPNYCIDGISKNTEKCSGDMLSLKLQS